MKRTLLLAQRTADAAVAEAHDEARALMAAAEEKSRTMLAEAQTKAEQLVTDAEADARRAASVEKTRIEAEVAALTARRDELHGEATVLEGQIRSQRERIRVVAGALTAALSEPSGLVPTELATPTPARRGDGDPDRGEPAPGWADAPVHRGGSDDSDVAGDIARLTEPTQGRTMFDSGDGPPTAEVPVISADDELVRGFFEPEPFADERWKTRRAD
jgi:hypothetical protein